MRDHWEKEFPLVDETGIKLFATAIGDNNPLHHDNEAARRAGLHGIVAPGVMLTGYASSTMACELPNAMVCKLEMKLIKPLYAGSLPFVVCNMLKQRGRIAHVAITIRNGFQTLAQGSCTLLLPQ